jgi:hypothetical protein
MYFDGRPIYRIDGATKVYADTGDLVPSSAGGLVPSATTLVPSWRRLARHARRVRYVRVPQRGVRETLGAGLRSPGGPTQSST